MPLLLQVLGLSPYTVTSLSWNWGPGRGPRRLAPPEGAGFLSQACPTSFCALGHVTDPSPFSCRLRWPGLPADPGGGTMNSIWICQHGLRAPEPPDPRKRLTAQRLLCCTFLCGAAPAALLTLSHQDADPGAENCEHSVRPRTEDRLVQETGEGWPHPEWLRVPGRRRFSSLPCGQPLSQDVLPPPSITAALGLCIL